MKSDTIVNEIKLFREYIMNKYNSENTASAYGSAVTSFLFSHPEVSRPSEINAQQIIRYCLKFNNLSTRRNVHSAIKLFYKFKSKHGESSKFRYIPYPEKPYSLPNHVTKNEFIKLMQVCDNLKHRCILMCGFDAGMRVSEVVNLKLNKLNFELMQIHISQSKGRKDRIVKLSPVFANFLSDYIEEYNPVKYVFNGQFSLQYSTRSCEEILTKKCKLAGLPHHKYHELRHGFSMALYENGYGLDTIGDLLGHQSRKTTEIYARKNNIVIQKTQYPLEQILIEHHNRLHA